MVKLYFTKPLGISLVLLVASILTAVALLSIHWVVVPSEGIRFGLLTACTANGCGGVQLAGDVFNLLVAAWLIGLLVSFPYAVLEVFRNYGWYLVLAIVSGIVSLLIFAALIRYVVIFSVIIEKYYSWSFAVGWLALIVNMTAGGLSLYFRQKSKEAAPATGETVVQPQVNSALPLPK